MSRHWFVEARTFSEKNGWTPFFPQHGLPHFTGIDVPELEYVLTLNWIDDANPYDALGYAVTGVPPIDDYCANAVNGEWGCYTQSAGGSRPNAAISWTEAVGTVFLYGGVEQAWTNRGGASGLGWPKSLSPFLTGSLAPVSYTEAHFPYKTIRCMFNELSSCFHY